MAYEHGALEAALAAAVGDEPQLIAELRGAFFASANAHVAEMHAARSPEDWCSAAQRLKGLAASFGARRLMDAAGQAIGLDGDLDALDKIERAIAALEG